ncbi:MAG: aminopeptidase P family protein [Geminicoccaceae bacterium]|nr:MAG: aminopeptidase P family protein [Geminicoccaceae bacterium]
MTPHAQRLVDLRLALGQAGVDGFVLPRTDMYGSEYLPPGDERVAWLTGFTGSAARVAILPDTAAVFTDGRYTLQVKDEVAQDLFETRHILDEPLAEWLAERVHEGMRIGYDPQLHLKADVERLQKVLDRKGATLVALQTNPVDDVWLDRPSAPRAAMRAQPPALAGETSLAKRQRLLAQVEPKAADGFFVSTGDGVAWLLNLRGADIPFNPLCLGLCLVLPGARAVFLTDPAKRPQGFAFEDDGIALEPLDDRLALYAELAHEGARILVDPAVTHLGLIDELTAAGLCVVEGTDPVGPAKARKNKAEIAGAKRAQIVDGAAVTRFLAWLDRQTDVDELTAAAALEAERAKDLDYAGPSFDTISGAGPNGAIVHYRVSAHSNRKLERGSLYLVDSGGQYKDATTDITRTVAIGEPTPEMRRRFTLVLEGHVALATAVFPKDTRGSQLDVLARRPLWEAGLDFDHGTGHGIGAALCVHEGPQRIAKRGGDVKLEPGMIVSNEPGNYPTGQFGIRTENLMLVVERGKPEGGDVDLLGFDILTLAPIDRRLVEPTLLSPSARTWLDTYHARVRQVLGPLLDTADRAWLEEATAPLAAG